jgi:predicted nucleotidyltransferase
MITADQKKIILTKLAPFKPKKVSIFGSYSRNENTTGSDLDLLVEFGLRINLLDLIGIEQALSEALGIKVDLVTEGSLDPLVKPYVEMDLKPILVNEE